MGRVNKPGKSSDPPTSSSTPATPNSDNRGHRIPRFEDRDRKQLLAAMRREGEGYDDA
jgi:hypothetical protein